MADLLVVKQKTIFHDLLYVFFGAAVVLLLTSLDQGSFWYPTTGHSGSMYSITAWFGPWIILQIASFFVPVWMFVQRDWRRLPFDEKSGLIFGYLAVFWGCLTAFVFRVSSMLNWTHIVLIISGAAMTASYFYYRTHRNKPLEMFP